MKIMTKALNRTTLGLALGLASSQLLAAGFALNEQSISGMGTGFAGRSSSADVPAPCSATLPACRVSNVNKSA